MGWAQVANVVADGLAIKLATPVASVDYSGASVVVKTAKGRKLSSTLWLERQLNDPYVTKAKREGYRGRAAYKIMELDDKYGFFKPGARVVDLGCAPGGWCQVAVPRVNALGEKANKPIGTVLGVDLQEIEPIAGCELHQLDFLAEDADGLVKGWLGGKADVVLSDMAASASGHKGTDHLRIIALVEAAFAASQVDELYQVERWGEDEEAADHRAQLLEDFRDASRFLDLLAA
jgi:cell division protein FtsJ